MCPSRYLEILKSESLLSQDINAVSKHLFYALFSFHFFKSVVSQLDALTNCPILPGLCNSLVNAIISDLHTKGEEVVRMNVQVRELLFEGMDVGPIFELLETIVNLLGLEMPVEFEGGTFGIYKGVSTNINCK